MRHKARRRLRAERLLLTCYSPHERGAAHEHSVRRQTTSLPNIWRLGCRLASARGAGWFPPNFSTDPTLGLRMSLCRDTMQPSRDYQQPKRAPAAQKAFASVHCTCRRPVKTAEHTYTLSLSPLSHSRGKSLAHLLQRTSRPAVCGARHWHNSAGFLPQKYSPAHQTARRPARLPLRACLRLTHSRLQPST